MARAQAQYLRIFDGNTTYQRWQNFYVNTTIAFDGATWLWLPFDCDGMTDGAGSDEGDLNITVPATPMVVAEVEAAIRTARLVEIQTYDFNVLRLGGETDPLSDQTLIASYVGEVVGAGGGFETLELELGSSLSPVGAQAPPRTFTTTLVGAPCKLSGGD